MSISFDKRPEMVVKSFSDQLGGLSVRELQKSLEGLDLKDSKQVTKEVKRCNDRCNGNTVDASLMISQSNQGGGIQERQLDLKFRV